MKGLRGFFSAIVAVYYVAGITPAESQEKKNFAGFEITFPSGVPAQASMSIPTASPVDVKASVNLNKDGEIESGSITGSFTIPIRGFVLTATHAVLDAPSKSVVLDGTMTIGDNMNMQMKGIHITKQGITQEGVFVSSTKQLSAGGFRFSDASLQSTPKGIALTGTITLPLDCGSVTATALFQSSTDVTFSFAAAGASFTYKGFQIAVTDAAYANQQITLAGTVTLPPFTQTASAMPSMTRRQSGITGEILIKGFIFNASGIVQPPTVTLNGFQYTAGQFVLKATDIIFSEPDGLSLNGSLQLPGSLGSVAVNSFAIHTNGNTECASISFTQELNLGFLKTSVSSARWSNGSFLIDGSVTFPQDIGTIAVSGLQLHSDGSCTEAKISTQTPLKLGQFQFAPASFQYGGGSVVLSGAFTIPELGTISFKGVTIASDGSIQSGIADLSSAASLSFRSYALRLLSVQIRNGLMDIQGSISLPGTVDNLNITLQATPAGISIVSIHAPTTSITLAGFSCSLDSISMASVSGIAFSGNLRIPSIGSLGITQASVSSTGAVTGGTISPDFSALNFGGFHPSIGSATLTNNAIVMKTTFTLPGMGTVHIPSLSINPSGNCTGRLLPSMDSLSLHGFSASILSGSFQNNSLVFNARMTLPSGFGAVTLQGVKITSALDVSVTNIIASGIVIQRDNFAIIVSSLTWNSDRLSMSGTIKLPGTFGTIAVNNCSIDAQGTVSGGTLDFRNASVTYEGFKVAIQSGECDWKTVTLNGSITLPGTAGTVSVAGLELSGSGIISPGAVQFTSSSFSWHGYAVTVKRVTLQAGAAYVDGSINAPDLGSISVDSMGITSAGTFLPGRVTLASTRLISYGGFNINIVDARFETNYLEMDGAIAYPRNNSSFAVSNLRMGTDGKPVSGTVTYRGAPIALAGGQLTPGPMSLAGGVITGNATFLLPKNLATMTAYGVKINSSFDVTFDSLAARGVSIMYNDYRVDISSIVYKDEEFVLNGSLGIPSFGTATIRNLIITSTGMFQGGSISVDPRPWTWGGLTFAPSDIAYNATTRTLSVAGKISGPQIGGTISVKDVAINSAGTLVSGTVITEGQSIGYAGYTLALISGSMTQSEIVLSGSVSLPNNGGKITANKFIIGSNTTIDPGTWTYTGDGISIGGMIVTIKSISLSTDGITCTGTLKLPPSTSGSIVVHNARISSSGGVSIQSVEVVNVTGTVGGFTLTLTFAAFDGKRFAASGTIVIPGTGTFGVEDVVLNGTELTEARLTLDHATITHLGFTVQNLSGTYANKAITLNGTVVLPANLGTMKLAGAVFDGSGVKSVGSVTYNGTTIQWNSYAVTVDSATLSASGLDLNGSITMGTAGGLQARHLCITSKGQFTGGTILLAPAPKLTLGGFTVIVTKVDIQGVTIEIDGTVTLPGNATTLILKDVNLDVKGMPSKGSITYSGPPIQYGDYSLTPDKLQFVSNGIKGRATFAIQTATGSADLMFFSSPYSVSVTNVAVQNVKVTYGGFAITISSFASRGDSLLYSGSIAVQNVGSCTVKNLTMNKAGKVLNPGQLTFDAASFAWGQYTIQVDNVAFGSNALSMSGRLILPNNAGTIKVTDLTVSTSGTILQGTLSSDNLILTYAGYSLTPKRLVLEADGVEMDAVFTIKGLPGDVTVNSLEFHRDGTVKLKEVVYAAATITVGKFIVKDLQFISTTLKDLTINGTLQLPQGVGGTVTATGIQFDANGTASVQSIAAKNVVITYQQYQVTLVSAAYANERITVTGTMQLPNGSGQLTLKDLSFDAAGNFYGGSLQLADAKVSYQGWDLTLSSAAIDANGIVTLNGAAVNQKIQPPIRIDVTGFSFQGTKVLTYGTTTLEGGTIVWNNYTVTVDTVQLSSGTMTFSGSVVLPGKGSVRASDICVDKNGNWLSGNLGIASSQTLTFAGFTVTLDNLTVQSDGTLIYDGTIILPDNNGKFIGKGVTITPGGQPSGGTWRYDGPGLTYNGYKLIIQTLSLLSDGLHAASVSLQLPNSWGTVIASDVAFTGPLNITVGRIDVTNVSFSQNGFTFTLTDAGFNGSSLSVSAGVTAPTLGKASVQNLTITNTGQLQGGTLTYSNSWKWGTLAVNVDSLSYDWNNGIAVLNGTVTLPNNVGTVTATGVTINTRDGSVQSAGLDVTTTLTYGGRGVTSASAVYTPGQIAVGGTILLGDQLGSITISSLDIATASGAISGGQFTYNPGQPITFGGCIVTIRNVTLTPAQLTLTADLQLPQNLGTATAENATFALDGRFHTDDVLLKNIQPVMFGGFSFQLVKGTIRESNILLNELTATIGGTVTIGYDSLLIDANGMHDGRFDFSKTKIDYKGYVVAVAQSQQLSNGGVSIDGTFQLPESKGPARVNDIILTSLGPDFTKAKIDYSSLPNLLPAGFKANIAEAEFVDGGFEVSGTIDMLPLFKSNFKKLLVAPDKIAVAAIEMDLADFSVGSIKFPGLILKFAEQKKTWGISVSGDVSLADGAIKGLSFSGTVYSDGNFDASLITSVKAIPIGEGFYLVRAGGGFAKNGSDYETTINGTFVPADPAVPPEKSKVTADGTLTIHSTGIIDGALDVKMFGVITMAKANTVLDLKKKTMTIDGTLTTAEVLTYKGTMTLTARPFSCDGTGTLSIVGFQAGSSKLVITDSVAETDVKFAISNPKGGSLIDVAGKAKIRYAGDPQLSIDNATLSLDGYSIAGGSLIVSNDKIAATGKITILSSSASLQFLATRTPPPQAKDQGGTPASYKPGERSSNSRGELLDVKNGIDLDVLKSDYPSIYQEILDARLQLTLYHSGGFGRAILEADLIDKISETIFTYVNVAGLDTDEIHSEVKGFLEGPIGMNEVPSPVALPDNAPQSTGAKLTIAHQASPLLASVDKATLDLTPEFAFFRVQAPRYTDRIEFVSDADIPALLEASAAGNGSSDFSVQYFTATATIVFRGLTFASSTLTIAEGSFSGTGTVTIPGVGSGNVTFQGDKDGIKSFSGTINATLHGYHLSTAAVSYTCSANSATMSLSDTYNVMGSNFAASATVDEKGGTFTISSFKLHGNLDVDGTVHFDFHWKCFHIKIHFHMRVNFGTATFTYAGNGFSGSVDECIDFPWPIHKKCISFDVNVSTSGTSICFDLFGSHCL